MSIVTRSTTPPHPDDRVYLWKQRLFVRKVSMDLRKAIQDILDRHRHLVTPGPVFSRMPELDHFLDFLAAGKDRQQAARPTSLRILTSVLGWIGLLAVACAVWLLLAVVVVVR